MSPRRPRRPPAPPPNKVRGRQRRRQIRSAAASARGRSDVPKIVDWYMDGKIQVDPLITHKLEREDINHGLELMERGESMRSVVVY